MLRLRWFAAMFAAAAALFGAAAPAQAEPGVVFVEAESFEDHGGWVLDTQFIQLMGSPYLMAHGLGRPVADATTTVAFPEPGEYRVYVRTKDWVARWDAPGSPGRFQLVVDGKPLDAVFGAKGAEWHWQDGGTVKIAGTTVKLALRDLTGFNGRCDAILFTKNPDYVPPNDSTPHAAWRKKLLGLPEEPVATKEYDLVVIGGGYAGCGAAISAARMGLRVALIQERPVLGGNSSSEIRVWPQGLTRRGLFPRIGEIIEEFSPRPRSSPAPAEEFQDDKKEKVVRAEKNIDLFLNHHAYRVEMSGERIAAVVAFDTRTGEHKRFAGRMFADCTGHGWIGAMAGADYEMLKEGHLGMSNMWMWEETNQPHPFPETPWALDLEMDDFPYPVNGRGPWFWETGFDKHPIHDLEYMRDWNLRAVYGAWNAMKNRGGKEEHVNARLTWIAPIGGTRESRRLLGDVVLTGEDVVTKREFPDGCVPTTWSIDLHYPQERYINEKYPDDPFISKAIFDHRVDKDFGYPVPYRCFYSRNVPNLFMAGRNVSVDQQALGTVRVMKTGGMMGEVVGKAASICIRNGCDPREVYEKYLDELKELLHLPGVARRETVDGEIVIEGPVPPLPQVTVPKMDVDPASLPGLVIDNRQAKAAGNWTAGTGLEGYIGMEYLYSGPNSRASIRFEFTVDKPGRYEVRKGFRAHENRAASVPVKVQHAGGTAELTIDQRQAPPLPGGFVSLGVFEFSPDKPGAVTLESVGTNGHVCADAVQVLPAP